MRLPIWGAPQQAQNIFEDQKFWDLPVENPEAEEPESHKLTPFSAHEEPGENPTE